MPHALNLLTAAALALAAAAPVGAQTLDDFNGAIGTNTVYFDNVPARGVLESLVAAPVPGGTRRLQLTPDLQATGGSSAAINGFGDLSAFAGGTQRLAFNFAYGTQAPMNLDLSGAAALRLDFYFGTPLSLVVYASTQTGLGTNPDASAVTLALPALFRQSYDIPLSSFVANSSTGRPVNWADVDGLAFFVSAAGPMPEAGDAFWVERLSAVPLPVPEPASAALMALGLAALTLMRRRDRRA